MNIVFLGPPGAGKGTQAQLLSKRLNIPHVSTGEILREYSQEDTDLGKEIKSKIDNGLLISNETLIKIVSDRLSRSDCNEGVILDGYPRRLQQAVDLDSIINIDVVVKIDLEHDAIVERLLSRKVCVTCKQSHCTSDDICECGGSLSKRVDDNETAILARIKGYVDNIAPITEYYIDGEHALIYLENNRTIEDTECELWVQLESCIYT